MSMKKVFLSGGIEHLADKGETWRQKAVARLSEAGFDPISPSGVLEGKFAHVNEVVHRNLHLQKTCDITLVEYSIPNRAYIGTDFEIVMAHQWQQPVIVWAHDDHANRVYMKYLATKVVSTLDDAIDYIVAYY